MTCTCGHDFFDHLSVFDTPDSSPYFGACRFSACSCDQATEGGEAA